MSPRSEVLVTVALALLSGAILGSCTKPHDQSKQQTAQQAPTAGKIGETASTDLYIFFDREAQSTCYIAESKGDYNVALSCFPTPYDIKESPR